MQSIPKIKRPEDSNHWILNLIGLLFFGTLAWWSYAHITRIQSDGGYLSFPKPIMLLYDTMGKWGVVGFWLLFVVYNLIKGVVLLFKKNKSK
ncbi:hypothetical protein [Ferruginibacter profundus]